MCAYCVIKELSKHGPQRFKCPCDEKVTRIDWKRPQQRFTRSGGADFHQVGDGVEVSKGEAPKEEPPLDADVDSLRLFLRSLAVMNKEPRDRKIGRGLLYNTMAAIVPKPISSDDDFSFNMTVHSFSLSMDGAYLPSIKDEQSFLKTATWLHRPLIALSRIPADDDDDASYVSDDEGFDSDDEEDVLEFLSDTSAHDANDDFNSNDDSNYNANNDDPNDMSVDGEYEVSNEGENEGSKEAFENVKFIRDYLPPHKLLKQTANEEIRLLPRYFYALISGHTECSPDVDNVSPYEQSKLFASILMSDSMLRASNPKRIGESTRLIGHVLDRGTDTEIRNVLSRFRVTTSREHRRRTTGTKTLELFSRGEKLNPHDIPFLTADNLELQVVSTHGMQHY
jgi:hypothetical protein